MDATEYRGLDGAVAEICALEWVALAMDAANAPVDRDESGRFRLDFSQLYCERLTGL